MIDGVTFPIMIESFYEAPLYRPPSEADGTLIRTTRGCPWNRCRFCSMYRDVKFGIRSLDEIRADIDRVSEILRGTPKTAFIGDSNSLIMKTDDLVEVIKYLYLCFPHLERVTTYARAHTILKKGVDAMRMLRKVGLSRVHVGLEAGDDELLSLMEKGVNRDEAITAGLIVKDAGLSLSEYVILGLGGATMWEQHARGTAEVLNAIDPDFIRLRTLMVIEGTGIDSMIKKGTFVPQTPIEILIEERLLIEKLDVRSELLSDHVSNYLSVNGKLPDNQAEMLEFLDITINSLKISPELGASVLQPERFRHL